MQNSFQNVFSQCRERYWSHQRRTNLPFWLIIGENFHITCHRLEGEPIFPIFLWFSFWLLYWWPGRSGSFDSHTSIGDLTARMVFLHVYNIHYSPSVRIIDLVSHTIYVVCVNFIHKWRDLHFKVDSERQIFWETFNGNFIYSQSFFFILFCCLAWGSNPGFTSNKPTYYVLDCQYGIPTTLPLYLLTKFKSQWSSR